MIRSYKAPQPTPSADRPHSTRGSAHAGPRVPMQSRSRIDTRLTSVTSMTVARVDDPAVKAAGRAHQDASCHRCLRAAQRRSMWTSV